jgi:SAM-dependent methyltransferase
MYSINVKSKDNTLTIKISNADVYKHYQKLQLGTPLTKNPTKRYGFIPSDDIDQNIHLLYNNYWKIVLEKKWYDNLPADPKILDIGSGIGILDFLAYQYLGNTGKFYLLDANKRTRFSNKNIYSTSSVGHGFYNSHSVSKDIIKSTEFDPDNFIFLDISDTWPNIEFDLITSFSSWCWHYPLDTYWAQVKKHLKVGGKLVLTISASDDKNSNAVNTISSEFNSDPIMIEEWGTDGIEDTAINQGFRCCWIRK